MVSAESPARPVDRGLEVLRSQRPDLRLEGHEWFGWELPDQPRGRYLAVGNDQRGFVIDAVSGHVLWERPIDGRGGLPRSIAGIR